jgi:hypothetical protein
VLDRHEAEGGPGARAAGDELVRALMRFYGAGLARILELVSGPAATAPLAALLADDQVAGLLTLHDLHPEDLRTRVERALASVSGRPFELAGLDEAAARVTLRRCGQAHGCGCQSTLSADQEAAEAAIACFAPEIEAVEVAAPSPADGPLLQIGVRPGAAVSGAPR